MLADEIKKRIVAAMKAKQDVEKEILRLALSEIQAAEARSGEKVKDEDAVKIIRKLMKSNNEALEATDRPETEAKLRKENEILESLLPKLWGEAEIVKALDDVADDVKAAKNDGQATGVAMKKLKSLSAPVDGKSVSAAVRKMRAGD